MGPCVLHSLFPVAAAGELLMPKAPQLEMNWLDRAIEYVAPNWGARRMQSRYTMTAAQYIWRD